MIRLVDITFHANSEYAETTALLKAQQASLFYIDEIKNKLEVEVIKHVSAGTVIVKKENFKFFVGKNRPGYIPKATIAYLKQIQPQVIIVHGLGFSLQVLRLKMMFGNNVKIIVWHHAERPQGFPKKILYRFADLCIDKYLFTSKENAAEWIDAGIINHQNKIEEIPPTLTIFKRQDKTLSKQKAAIENGVHYLWVGRLNAVKDPVTVIDAFERFIDIQPLAKLHMIFQTGELLNTIAERVSGNSSLQENIILHGHVPNQELAMWYSAADFFISSSLREAGSVTILEAMSCGCIPIVTRIPASLKVTGNGEYGLNFPVGDVEALVQELIHSAGINRELFSEKIQSFYTKEFSVPAASNKLFAVCELLCVK